MSTKRLRVFAGPNGSGKSTIIESIRQSKFENKRIDFGIYINADDIARQLHLESKFCFEEFKTDITKDAIIKISEKSGLLNRQFNALLFQKQFTIKDNIFHLKKKQYIEEIAQILANFMREQCLEQGVKFSFETVFSHPGKVDFIKRAQSAGYKVYFYFVATEDPMINIFRVQNRVRNGGHNVPEDKIISRYYRSLALLKEATNYCYKAFFFDNSDHTSNDALFAQLVTEKNKKRLLKLKQYPTWFKKHFFKK